MKTSSNSYDKMAYKNKAEFKMRNLQNDTDLLLDENTEMMSVLNDLGELEDLTELYGDKNDIIWCRFKESHSSAEDQKSHTFFRDKNSNFYQFNSNRPFIWNLQPLNNTTRPTLLILLGPTGVGKTALSVTIANHFQTEIISCDSRQLFKEMHIGTAVPEDQILKKIPHHFIQSNSIFGNYNAARFETEVV